MLHLIWTSTLSLLLYTLLCSTNSMETWRTSTSTKKYNVTLQLGGPVGKAPLLGYSINFGELQHSSFWQKFNVSSELLKEMVKALAPYLIRWGGSETEWVTFHNEETDQSKHHHHWSTYNLTTNDVDRMVYYGKLFNFSTLIDVNDNLRYSNDSWNSANFISLLKYLRCKNVHKLVFQLGNEPNAYMRVIQRRISPEQLANDYKIMKSTMKKYDFNTDNLIGPEVTQPKHLTEKYSTESSAYLKDFLFSGGGNSVSCVTWHQYYLNSVNATLFNFTDSRLLDSFALRIKKIRSVMKAAGVDKPMCLTETGSAWGGGAAGLSDTYVSGFMFMDKLGMAAVYNITLIVRQSLFGGHYNLIDKHLKPRPDFWTSVLYRRLIPPRSKLLKILNPLHNKELRIYPFCDTNNSLILMTMNTFNHTSVSIQVSEYSGDYESYLLTPLHENLTSQVAELNYKKLKIANSAPYLPQMKPHLTKSISLPPLSYGFFVIRKSTFC